MLTSVSEEQQTEENLSFKSTIEYFTECLSVYNQLITDLLDH